MVVKSPRQYGNEGGQQTETPLTSLGAFVSELLVKSPDDIGDLGVKECHRAGEGSAKVM